MKKLLQIKFFLFSVFSFKEEIFSHSSFFWLGQGKVYLSVGAIGPFTYQTDSCYYKKPFDVSFYNHSNYKERAQMIANFFINKYKNDLPLNISGEKLLNDIICYSEGDGISVDLMLYSELLSKHKKIELANIYIAGTGYIDVRNGNVGAVQGIFQKLAAGINNGIRIFIFSSHQKRDIENFCNSYINNGGSHVIKSLFFYYVDNVNQLEEVLYDISKTKKKLYNRKSVREIRKKQHNCNILYDGGVNMDSPITKEFIQNKKICGCLRDPNYFKFYMKECLQKENWTVRRVIEEINDIASFIKTNALTQGGEEQNKIYEEFLEEFIFSLDPFYKRYYQSCVSEIIVTDQDILDM